MAAGSSYGTMVKESIFDRYKYARHVYGCQFDASQSGRTCIDPLFYHYGFPMTDIEKTFIVGDAIKVSPVLNHLGSDDGEFSVFFPPGRWVDLDDFSVTAVTESQGGSVNLKASTKVRKHLMPGAILPVQYNLTEANEQVIASSTEQLQYTDIHLVINKDTNLYASGRLFLDGGKNVSEIANKTYIHYEFQLNDQTLHKLDLNPDGVAEGKRMEIASIVLTDQKLPSGTDASVYYNKACFVGRDMSFYSLSLPEYSEEHSTLTYKAVDSDHPINMANMNMIQMCPTALGEDLGECLCLDSFGAYKYAADTDKTAALANASATLNLVGRSPGKLSDFQVAIRMGDGSHSDKDYKSDRPMINIKI